MSQLPFGFSSVIDFGVPNEEQALNKEYIREFIIDLISVIDMQIYDNHLYVEKWAAKNAPETFGVSAICFLTTSSLSLHTTEEGKIMIDLFSCKDYQLDPIKAIIRDYFGKVEWFLVNKMCR